MKKILFVLLLLIPVLTLAQVKNFTVTGTVTANSFKLKNGTFNDTIISMANNGNNLYLGYNFNKKITTGTDNFVFGKNAGIAITSGNNNILLGLNSGSAITSSSDNIMVGTGTGRFFNSTRNILIGTYAGGASNFVGYNTFVGCLAGNVCTGGNNLFLGYAAGSRLTAYSNRGVLSTLLQPNIVSDTNAAPLYFNQNLDTNKTFIHQNAKVNIGSRRGEERFNVWGNAKIYGNLKVTGEIYPKIYNQATEPDIPNNSFAFWFDSRDYKMKLILDYDGEQYLWLAY